jgi:biopolymer transport protein ExbB/TolQ
MPIIEAFKEADLFGQAILLILFFLSMIAWSVILRKLILFRSAKAASRNFRAIYQSYRSDPLSLISEDVYFPESPFYELCDEALSSLQDNFKEVKVGNPKPAPKKKVTRSGLEVIEKSLDRRITSETTNLEKNLSLLATAASVSPFLGLLGTVWGLLVAFQEMAAHNSARLSVVAPGIAEALVTTVVGLIVAIPSLVMYNYMASSIKKFETEMEGFASELLADIEKKYVAA